MFDIGFWEVIFIAVITLLVVGPERLPKVARTAGLWMGKIRGFVVSVKADIDKELAADELRRTLQKQASVKELEELVDETTGDLLSDNLSKPAGRESTLPASESGDVKDDRQAG